MKKKKLYIKDWLALKPYKSQKKTDLYYLKLANDVHKITDDLNYLGLRKFLGQQGVDSLCCFLVSYFEDVISKTNIWACFVKKHRELYQKPLPFYETGTYFEEEINTADVAFLSWYFINSLQDEVFIPPQSVIFTDFAFEVMAIFDREYEYAPENEYLKSYYTLDVEEVGYEFYAARELFGKILLDSYLFYPDTRMAYLEQQEEILEDTEDKERISYYLREHDALFMNQTRTRLLALRAKDWAAALMGPAHPHHKDMTTVSERISSFFFYKGQDENSIKVEHIASGKKFEIAKESYDHAHTLTKIGSIIFMGIVRWNNVWWFSGISFQEPHNEERVNKEKKSIRSQNQVSFLDFDSPESNSILQKQEKAFLELNKGGQIAFIRGNEVQEFLNDYNVRYNGSLGLSKKEKRAAEERQEKYSILDEDTDNPAFEEDALVFYNPKSGLEIAFGLNSAFPTNNNPFYNEDKHDEALRVILKDADFSTELAKYCLELHEDPQNAFYAERDNPMLKDIDFMLRFWKTENYHTVPQVTLVD